jgi:hypothetical protein
MRDHEPKFPVVDVHTPANALSGFLPVTDANIFVPALLINISVTPPYLGVLVIFLIFFKERGKSYEL